MARPSEAGAAPVAAGAAACWICACRAGSATCVFCDRRVCLSCLRSCSRCARDFCSCCSVIRCAGALRPTAGPDRRADRHSSLRRLPRGGATVCMPVTRAAMQRTESMRSVLTAITTSAGGGWAARATVPSDARAPVRARKGRVFWREARVVGRGSRAALAHTRTRAAPCRATHGRRHAAARAGRARGRPAGAARSGPAGSRAGTLCIGRRPRRDALQPRVGLDNAAARVPLHAGARCAHRLCGVAIDDGMAGSADGCPARRADLGAVVVVGDEEGYVWVHSPSGGLRATRVHRSAVFDFDFVPGEHSLVTASGDQTVCLVDIQRESVVRASFFGHTASVKSVCFKPDDSSKDRAVATAAGA